VRQLGECRYYGVAFVVAFSCSSISNGKAAHEKDEEKEEHDKFTAARAPCTSFSSGLALHTLVLLFALQKFLSKRCQSKSRGGDEVFSSQVFLKNNVIIRLKSPKLPQIQKTHVMTSAEFCSEFSKERERSPR
jgi:hypothetical protein